MAENPAKVAEVNEELAKFKAQTGLDPRSFQQIALGMSYTYPSAGVTKINTVALASGTFNPAHGRGGTFGGQRKICRAEVSGQDDLRVHVWNGR